MKLSSPATIFDLNPYDENSVQMHNLGQRGETSDGRVFRYAWMGEAITPGRLVQGPAINSTLTNMAVLVGALNAKQITFTNAVTTTTANYWNEGYAFSSYATGAGQTWKIKSLPALVSGASSTVYLEDPIAVALDTTTKLGLVQNPYSQVLMGATATFEPVGASFITYTTQYYGWLQTRGVCAIFSDGAIAAGTAAENDGSVSGAIDVMVEADWVVNPSIGRAYQIAGAQNYWEPVFLTIE